MYFLGSIGSLLGLIVSLYIYRTKRKKTKLICPRESNCEKVVHSTHATTMGVPNELLGILFYITQAALWTGLLLVPELATPWYLFTLVILTIGGVLFSIYLIALQALVIHAWCAWCLGSAVATGLLTVALFCIPTEGLFTLLGAQRTWWIIVHNIGFILGLGGATITDIFFFRFLKDQKISEEEKGTMDTLTNVIWVGLAVLIVSGLMLYLPDQLRLNESPKFLLKVVVVGVIVINGLLLNLKVAPRMRSFSFDETIPARHLRRLAFALGAISLTSWYTAFFLGSLRRIHVVFGHGILIYLGIVVVAVIGSQIFEMIVSRKARQSVPPSQSPSDLV